MGMRVQPLHGNVKHFLVHVLDDLVDAEVPEVVGLSWFGVAPEQHPGLRERPLPRRSPTKKNHSASGLTRALRPLHR